MQLQKMKPSVYGLAVVAASLAGVTSALALAVVRPITSDHTIASVVGSFLAYVPLSVFAALILGGPAFLLLVSIGAVKWWIWVPLALILSPLIELMANGISQFDLDNLAIFAPLSLMSAGVFRVAFEYWQRANPTGFQNLNE